MHDHSWGGLRGGQLLLILFCVLVFHGFFSLHYLLMFVCMVGVIYVVQILQSYDYACAEVWSLTRVEIPPQLLRKDKGALCAIQYLLLDHSQFHSPSVECPRTKLCN